MDFLGFTKNLQKETVATVLPILPKILPGGVLSNSFSKVSKISLEVGNIVKLQALSLPIYFAKCFIVAIQYSQNNMDNCH